MTNSPKHNQRWQERNPWYRPYERARRRCTDKKHKSYYSYGERGIKFRLHIVAVITLWFRDMAFLMSRPTLDRIDPDGHYELHNCKFLEFSENEKARRQPYCAPRLDGEWEE
jgi:hypothetical protein